MKHLKIRFLACHWHPPGWSLSATRTATGQTVAKTCAFGCLGRAAVALHGSKACLGWIFQLPRIRVAHSGKTNVPNLVFEVTMQRYILPPNPECFFGSICSYSVFSNGHTVNNPLVEAYTFHSFECVDFKEEREHHL